MSFPVDEMQKDSGFTKVHGAICCVRYLCDVTWSWAGPLHWVSAHCAGPVYRVKKRQQLVSNYTAVIYQVSYSEAGNDSPASSPTEETPASGALWWMQYRCAAGFTLPVTSIKKMLWQLVIKEPDPSSQTPEII